MLLLLQYTALQTDRQSEDRMTAIEKKLVWGRGACSCDDVMPTPHHVTLRVDSDPGVWRDGMMTSRLCHTARGLWPAGRGLSASRQSDNNGCIFTADTGRRLCAMQTYKGQGEWLFILTLMDN